MLGGPLLYRPRTSSAIVVSTGLSSLGVPGVPFHPQILADQLILSQPRGADYLHQIILAPPDFHTFQRPCSWGPRGPLKFRRPRPAISESYGWCNIVLCSGKNTVFKCSTYNKEGNSSVLDYLLKWVLTFLMSFFSFLGQDDYYHEKLSTRIKGFAVFTTYC